MSYLLDTNVISDLVRNPRGRSAERIASVGENNICTSIVVSAELRFGVAKKRSSRLARQLEEVLGAIEVLPFQAPADSTYAQVRTKLEAAGTPIGGNDLLIATHALSLGLTLVTDNEREFGYVQGLNIENWLR
jgi:tRNA(fMet)-specific endonuclease VapC